MLAVRGERVCVVEVLSPGSNGLSVRRAQDRFQEVRCRRAEGAKGSGATEKKARPDIHQIR